MAWQWRQDYMTSAVFRIVPHSLTMGIFKYFMITAFLTFVHLNLMSRCFVCPIIIPGCEDIIVESLSLDSLVPILKWSSQPYGSKWVHRQAMHFLCEEFSQVVSSDVLYELSKEHLLSAIQSDYLQVRRHRLLLSGASHNTDVFWAVNILQALSWLVYKFLKL